MTSKISIIVPVYNVEALLPRCLDSIINQTYKNIEVILINDGSTDKSGHICDSYVKADRRIKVFHQLNKGQGNARNEGLKHAKGDYIGFVDSDDWIDPHMYEAMLEALIKTKANLAECGINETKKFESKADRTGSIILESKLEALKRIIKHQRFSVCNKLFPIELIKDIKFKEGKISEDAYFTFQVIQRITNSVRLTNRLYNYYVAGDSTTRGNYNLRILDSLDAAMYIEGLVNKNESDEDLIAITQNFVLHSLVFNYKMLHYNSHFDKDSSKRRKLKSLIKKYYQTSLLFNLQYTLARYLPIITYNWLISLNKIRRPNLSH